MIEVSDSTRSGRSIAIVWAIIPPIEAPTTCAALDAEVVEQPEGVVGHVLEQVGRVRCSQPDERAPHVGHRSVDLASSGPTSRLSNRITWKPRSASCSQNSGSQSISCMPRPMTSSSGGFGGSPNVS